MNTRDDLHRHVDELDGLDGTALTDAARRLSELQQRNRATHHLSAGLSRHHLQPW